jgi:hypothetical protein
MISKMRPAASPWKTALIWTFVILAGLAVAAVYFYQKPEQLPDWAARSGLGRDLQTTTVYKWQDASGRWHVSDRKPPGVTDYQAEEYTRDRNVLPLPPQLQD